MKRTLKVMLLAIGVNLVIWLIVAGMLLAPQVEHETVKGWAVAGAGLAAVIQHWAYYAVHKRARQM